MVPKNSPIRKSRGILHSKGRYVTINIMLTPVYTSENLIYESTWKHSHLENVVHGILDTHDLREVAEGVIWDNIWKQIKRSPWKQQPVWIIDISDVDNNQYEIVVRPSGDRFGKIYREHAPIRKHFPKLYGYFQNPRKGDHNGRDSIYIIERIHGYEEKQTVHAADMDTIKFEDFIEDDTLFLQFCEEVWHIIDDILSESLTITDFDPIVGHNIIYNTSEKRFQPFDIDTVRKSDSLYEYKLTQLLDDSGKRNYSEKRVRFLFFILGKIQAKIWLDRLRGILVDSYEQVIIDEVTVDWGMDSHMENNGFMHYKTISVNDPLHQVIRNRWWLYQNTTKDFKIYVKKWYHTTEFNTDILNYFQNNDVAWCMKCYTKYTKFLKHWFQDSKEENWDKRIQEYYGG